MQKAQARIELLKLLRERGFTGSDDEVLKAAYNPYFWNKLRAAEALAVVRDFDAEEPLDVELQEIGELSKQIAPLTVNGALEAVMKEVEQQ